MEKKNKKESNVSTNGKRLKPLGDRVLIKEIDRKKENETKSGIIIPETVDKESGARRGEVLATGEGRFDDGVLVPMSVKTGDIVLFQWGEKITIDSEEYWIVSESNILAVIK